MTTVQRLKEVDIVAAETLRKQLKLLQTICLREKLPGRSGYPSFAKFKSNILDLDYRDFFQWSKEWKGIYEVADH